MKMVLPTSEKRVPAIIALVGTGVYLVFSPNILENFLNMSNGLVKVALGFFLFVIAYWLYSTHL